MAVNGSAYLGTSLRFFGGGGTGDSALGIHQHMGRTTDEVEETHHGSWSGDAADSLDRTPHARHPCGGRFRPNSTGRLDHSTRVIANSLRGVCRRKLSLLGPDGANIGVAGIAGIATRSGPPSCPSLPLLQTTMPRSIRRKGDGPGGRLSTSLGGVSRRSPSGQIAEYARDGWDPDRSPHVPRPFDASPVPLPLVGNVLTV